MTPHPNPMTFFFHPFGTCAGVHIVYFCENRNIPIDDISMTLHFERNETSHLMEKIAIDVKLPPDFPPNYKKAVIRAAQMCTVKRNQSSRRKFW